MPSQGDFSKDRYRDEIVLALVRGRKKRALCDQSNSEIVAYFQRLREIAEIATCVRDYEEEDASS